MSNKRQKKKFDAKRENRRLKRLAEEEQGRLKNLAEMPRGAVASDVSQVVWNTSSYSPPPLYYLDREFTCVDCRREEVWTAEQQKRYYEVAKGSLYAMAVRCQDCRRKRAERYNGRGDPNPIKHVGTLLKRIHGKIAPRLKESGFEPAGTGTGLRSRPARLEYSRHGMILQCLFARCAGRLIAETLDADAEYRVVADVELSGLHAKPELDVRVDEFASAVESFLRKMPPIEIES